MRLKTSEARYLVHHVALPPKLPQEDDWSEHHCDCLLQFTEETFSKYVEQDDHGNDDALLQAHKMLQNMVYVMARGTVNADALNEVVKDLSPGCSLPVHIREQNAAIIFRRIADAIDVECFEASPPSHDVLTTNGALIRTFPTDTVTLTWEQATEPQFRAQLAHFLADVNTACNSSMLPESSKAGIAVPEIRSTPNPKLITQIVMNVLVAYGIRKPPSISAMIKRYRDDVLWQDARKPWRRNALWLAIRVGLQASFQHSSTSGKAHYKHFMVYYMCRLCQLAIDMKLEPDLVQIIVAKVARRLKKFGALEDFVAELSLSTCYRARSYLQDDWGEKRAGFQQRLDPNQDLFFEPEHLNLQLTHSRPYIDKILGGTSTSPISALWSPETKIRVTDSAHLPDIHALLAESEYDFALLHVDDWVRKHLQQWVSSKLPASDDIICGRLGDLISTFYRQCLTTYESCPDQLSATMLTCLELWQALDQMVTVQYPLLIEYSPDIPIEFPEPLLLTRMDLMGRLHKFEEYLTQRHRSSHSQRPSLYSNPSSESFTVRYFYQSAQHIGLRDEIERHATRERDDLKARHQVKLQQYLEKKREYDAMKHDEKRNRKNKQVHDSRCRKCAVERAMESIELDVHEWPLPSDEIQCAAAVVELVIPASFATWRDVTYEIQGLGRIRSKNHELPKLELLRYSALTNFKQTGSFPQVSLASKAKTFAASHYRTKHVNNPIEDFLLPCGARYESYHSKEGQWLATPLKVDMRSKFQYCHDFEGNPSIDEGGGSRYTEVKGYTKETTHDTNEVVSDLSLCAPALTLHEFEAFGRLRSGNLIQWYNILRELTQPNLSWKMISVYNLICQAAHQVESRAEHTVLRRAHHVFEDHVFCDTMNKVLNVFIDRVRANWNEINGIATATELLLKNLFMSTSADAQTRSAAILNVVRSITLGWVNDLVLRLFEAENGTLITKIQQDIVYIACICKRTFDRDDDKLEAALASDEDIACYITCSIAIGDNCPADTVSYPLFLKRSISRDRALSYRFRPHILNAVMSSHQAMDGAVRQTWHHYDRSPAAPWESIISSGNRWIVTRTKDGQNIHYDVISGHLLVAGKRLGRLPEPYSRHPTYLRIFGNRVLDVLVTNQKGMEYMTQKQIQGYQVLFSLRDDELIVQTRLGDEILELIPGRILSGDLPKLFIDNNAHWINVNARTLEFRPLTSPWKPSPSDWCIKFDKYGLAAMECGTYQLVDWYSKSFEAIEERLAPIENKDFLHFMRCSSRGLIVRLPRYNLHFVVTNDMKTLHCPELGAIVEPDQNLGTLIGLQSRLLLKEEISCMRSILVPIGDVRYTSCASAHVKVHIDTSKSRSVHYCIYRIDSTLHRLCGPPKLFQGYYLAYLHALTTHVLPDPLTGLTGTDQALVILQQPCMLPTEPLSEDEATILDHIAKLTPKRKYYPPHLREMQTVRWDPSLSALSQHDNFDFLARRLFEHSKAIEHFFEAKTPKSELLDCGHDQELMIRARSRNAGHRNFSFGGDWSSSKQDKIYTFRDPDFHYSGVVQRVFEAAHLMRARPARIKSGCDLWTKIKQWSEVCGPERSRIESVGSLLIFQLPRSWASLYEYCREHQHSNHALHLSLVIGAIALSLKSISDFDMLRALVILTVTQSSKPMPKFPPYASFLLGDGCAPVENDMYEYMKNTALYNSAEEAKASRIESQSRSLAQYFMTQWPCDKPRMHGDLENYKDLPLQEVLQHIEAKFFSCYKNDCLRRHIAVLQSTLDAAEGHHLMQNVPTVFPSNIALKEMSHTVATDTIFDLMSRGTPIWSPILTPRVLIAKRRQALVRSLSRTESDHFTDLIGEMRSSQDPIERDYGQTLGISQAQYMEDKELDTPPMFPWSHDELLQNLQSWKSCLSQTYTRLVGAISSPKDLADRISTLARLAPTLRPVDLLRIVGGSQFAELSEQWQDVLLQYGFALVQTQRISRLMSLMKQGNLLAFYKESEHGGQEGWSARHYPSWLVLEADNNLMIRPIQAQVARQMLSSKGNSVLQLNMGDGKSSVIMPMLILALSDGARLARAIVLDSLAKPMQYNLRTAIGRILQRPIYFLPFSRSTSLDLSIVSKIEALQQQCLHDRGVLLAQPEHMLSFELIGIERLWSKEETLARGILQVKARLQSICWDIVDECDAVLVDNQLIYTVGSQQIVQGGSERWKTIQQLLSMVLTHAPKCRAVYPQHVELSNHGPGTFPYLRMSDPKAGKYLAAAIVEEIKKDTLINLHFLSLPRELQVAILAFVKDRDIPAAISQAVESHFAERPVLLDKILIIRGFLANEVLYFLLESKRWRVEYGLFPERCMMAVPYIAKDIPSPRAEFGHPDIALGLTCLSYYYSGLTSDQLLRCFEKLRSAGDPSVIYDEWVGASGLRDHLKSECNINLEDESQWEHEVYPGLRYQKSVVDYFLGHFVFPREAKEFPEKLPASGWDIPSRHPDTRTIGFSGTNDSNALLPKSILPQNLAELMSTTGRVVTYALQSQNDYLCAKDSLGQSLSVRSLLELISKQIPRINVLLDAGAQVLELRNLQVVQEWLEICQDIDVAIYYDDRLQEMTVLKRDGTSEPLVSSIYNAQTNRCLVYLDQVRTRGTDLKFPPDTRAAVTISRRLGKDAAMQAFMRLRDFGHSHSVLVLAPPEIDHEIKSLRDCNESESDHPLSMKEVLRWLFKQTVRNLTIGMPGWVEQGLSHRRRILAANAFELDHQDSDSQIIDKAEIDNLLNAWTEPEAKSLQNLYGPFRKSLLLEWMNQSDAGLASDELYQEIVNVGKNLSLHDHDIASRQQTYQREVELEAEMVRVVQRPAKAKAKVPKLRADIVSFVRNGWISPSCPAILSIPEALRKFSFSEAHASWPKHLQVSQDFVDTVESQTSLHEYINPVHWILSSTATSRSQIWLAVSPFEANSLIDLIKASHHVRLHIFAPNIRRLLPFAADSLKFFSISGCEAANDPDPIMLRELALFAGGLYLRGQHEYRELICHIRQQNGDPKKIGLAGPYLELIRSILQMRRKGEDFTKTHMGKILEEGNLLDKDFD